MNILDEINSVSTCTREHIAKLRTEEFLSACKERLTSWEEFSISNHENLNLPATNGLYLFWVNFSDSGIEWNKAIDDIYEIWNQSREGVIKYPKVVKKRAKKILAEKQKTE